LENDFRQPRDLLKKRQSDSLKKSTYSFSGDDERGDDDDE
jgi:hypothetical protein